MIPVNLSCPLGAKCEEVKDNTIVRCAWYTEIRGNNPQTGEKVDSFQCAMAWIPILLIENANTNRGQTEALCSMRDETMKRQDAALIAMLGQGRSDVRAIED